MLISSTVNPANVTTKFTGSTVPVIAWRQDLYDDLGMVTSGYYGTVASQIQLKIIDANHPLAGEDLIFDIELVEIVGPSPLIIMP